jgi:hypothetical protein
MPTPELVASLAERRYLIEDYAVLSKLVGQHQRDVDEQQLTEALETLCQTLDKLAGDGRFWADVIDLVSERGDADDETRLLLEDLDEFFTTEKQLIRDVQTGYDAELVDRMLDDARFALQFLRDAPSGAAVGNLQNRIADFRTVVCEESPARGGEGGFRRGLRVARTGLLVVAGGGLIVVDAITYIHVPHPLVLIKSAAGGLATIAGALPT